MGEETINIVSAYNPQIGLEESIKQKCCVNMVNWLRVTREKIYIGGDLNGNVGKDGGVFERVHRGQWYGIRNDLGDVILDFATTYDLILTNTWLKKRD